MIFKKMMDKREEGQISSEVLIELENKCSLDILFVKKNTSFVLQYPTKEYRLNLLL